MKIIDVVTQLHKTLPMLTDEFTESYGPLSTISHSSSSGGTITVTAGPGTRPEIEIGDSVYLEGVYKPVSISSIVPVPGTKSAIVTTSSDHDYTLYSEYKEGNIAVISGDTIGSIYNGSFTITAVDNRRVFTIDLQPVPISYRDAGGTLNDISAGHSLETTAGRPFPADVLVAGREVQVKNLTSGDVKFFRLNAITPLAGDIEKLSLAHLGGTPANWDGVGEGFEILNKDVEPTGFPIAENGLNTYNRPTGLFEVTGVHFQYPNILSLKWTIGHGGPSEALGSLTATSTAKLKCRPRITGAVSDEAAVAAYSRQYPPALEGGKIYRPWCFVVIDDASVSRGRSTRTDAVDDQNVGGDWQQYLIQPFSLLVAIPAANQSLGRNARDTAEDLLRPILRSVGGKAFQSGLAQTFSGPAQFVSHAFARYDGSVYWHEFVFEQSAVMTLSDTVGAGESVAFRDITLTLNPDFDPLSDAVRTSDLNLDKIPL